MLHTRCTKLPAQNFSSERSAKTQTPQLVQKNLEFHNNLQHRPQNFVVLYPIFRQKLHLSLFLNEETNPVQVRPFFSFDSKIALNFKGPILTTSFTPLFGKWQARVMKNSPFVMSWRELRSCVAQVLKSNRLTVMTSFLFPANQDDNQVWQSFQFQRDATFSSQLSCRRLQTQGKNCLFSWDLRLSFVLFSNVGLLGSFFDIIMWDCVFQVWGKTNEDQ